jgi:hypothetical protein
MSIWRPDLRCWLTNRRWCQLRSQRSAGTLTGNQLLPNASLERDGKVLIDLVDGLSSGLVVLCWPCLPRQGYCVWIHYRA